MSTNLAGVTLTYNGIDMGGPYTEVKISGRPVFDSAGRTVVYVVWTLNVHTFVTVSGLGDGLDVGDDLDAMKGALTRPGGELVYSGAGFGTFGINTAKADVAWGPRPRMVSWNAAGGNQTSEVTWQVEVAIAECGEDAATGIPLGTPRPPMEYCFQVGYTIDAEGYTTRTYSGHVTIAQTRRGVNDRTLADHADRLRETVFPACPPKFKEMPRNFTLSEDKCRLDFSVVHEQMPPNTPPPGCVSVSASHSVQATDLAMLQWNGTLSAEYTMAYAVPRQKALEFFVELVKDRVDQTRRIQQVRQGGGWAAALASAITTGGLVIPTSLTIAEPDIYGRNKASFSLTYKITLGPFGLASAVEAFGLFRPAPRSSWETWHASMRDAGVFGPRGHAGMKFDPKDDRLIDLCLGLGQGTKLGPSAGAASNLAGFLGGVLGGIGAGAGAATQAVNNLFQSINGAGNEIRPESSWLEYRNRVQVETGDDVVEQKLLPTASIKEIIRAQGELNEAGGGYKIPYANTPQSVVQYRGKPEMAIIMEGRAARAGYAINPPEIDRVGGVQAIPANRVGVEFFNTEVATSSIYPISVATWRLRWILPQVPASKIAPPDNPMAGKVITATRAEFGGLSAGKR